MRRRIKSYSFNAGTKQIVFTEYNQISLSSVLTITNTTSGIIIYNFADSTLKGTVSGNVLTLSYDTTSMGNNDELLIYYSDPLVNPNEELLAEAEKTNGILAEVLEELKEIKDVLKETGGIL